MAICLGINDDIIKLLKRYQDLKSNIKPEAFLSSFHTDYVAYNLNYSSNSESSNNYSGFQVDTGNKSISANITHDITSKKDNNSNLIDFNFSAPQDKNQNLNTEKNIHNNNSNNLNKPKGQGNMADINDIFDVLNKK